MNTTVANSCGKRLETVGYGLEVGDVESYCLGPFPTYSLQSKAYSLFTGDLTTGLFRTLTATNRR